MRAPRLALLFAGTCTAVGCIDNNAIDAPATKAPVEIQPQIVIVAASADDLIKPWPMEKLPGNVSELQRRTYTEFSNTLSFGGGRMLVINPGHTVPSPSDRYLIAGATLDFGNARDSDDRTSGKWKVTNVQLLGVHRNPQGHVYDVNLPKAAVVPAPGSEPTEVKTISIMEMMKITAGTRPLDPFEAEALAKLREGNQLAVKVDGDKMKMLGAVRTVSNNCISCHKFEKDHLMGAFTYELERVKEKPVTEVLP